jgi:hypothetical protein
MSRLVKLVFAVEDAGLKGASHQTKLAAASSDPRKRCGE